MIHQNRASLQQKMNEQRALRQLCGQAVEQQIERGEAEATHLRNRKRHLAKQVLKRIPTASQRSPRKLLHAATMVLAMWGFAGLTMSTVAEAAPAFKHFMLEGFNQFNKNVAPTFVDIDGDGDLDAFVGIYHGRVRFFRNNDASGNGTLPNFVADVAGNPLAGIDVGYDAKPNFADIDGDGDLDAFVGAFDGTVKFFRNNDLSGTGTAPSFVADVAGNPLAGIDVGYRAAPSFVDIDGDGDLDVFIGENSGTMKFYRNDDLSGTGTAPAFVMDVAGNPLASVAVGINARGTLDFADIDGDGDLDVFIGVPLGTVKFYRNNGTSLAPGFVADGAGNPLAGFDVGGNATPTFADIDGDGDFDAFVGEDLGDVKFYRNDDVSGNGTAPVFVTDLALTAVNVGSRSAPSFVDVDGDGDLDAFVGEPIGSVKFYRNDDVSGNGTSPIFVADVAGNPLAAFGALLDFSAPTFADIDGDGDLDAFVGEGYGRVKFYRNEDVSGNGTAPIFVAANNGTIINPLQTSDVGNKAKPVFVDIDGDGDLDVFIGESFGVSVFFRNDDVSGNGTAPVFVRDLAGSPLVGFDVGRDAAPSFVDIDLDGDFDAFIGDRFGKVKFYRNDDVSGNGTSPIFVADVAGNPLAAFDVGTYATPTFADIDGDGDFDAFVGESSGTVRFYENIDPSPITVSDTLAATADVAATTVDVTLNDTFKPEGPAGSFTITAFDAASVNGGTVVDNFNKTFTYTSAAGFMGADSFTYTLDDGAGNTAVGTVNVTIPDTIVPVITPPANITLEATGATTGVTLGTATVSDNVDVGLTATADLTGPFAVGVHTITWSATDAAGNTGTATQTVTITDTTAPVVTGPANLTVAATSVAGISLADAKVAGFLAGVSATDSVGVTSTTHDAPAVFPVGVTTVTFTVSDAAGNSTTGSGIVTVTAFVPGTIPVVSGGGCVIQPMSSFDPIFPAILALLAGLGLTRRRQK